MDSLLLYIPMIWNLTVRHHIQPQRVVVVVSTTLLENPIPTLHEFETVFSMENFNVSLLFFRYIRLLLLLYPYTHRIH